MTDNFNETETMRRIVFIIAKHLNVDENTVTHDASLIDDLGADSLDITEVMMQVEEEFNVEISDDAAQHLATARDILNYLGGKPDRSGRKTIRNWMESF